MILGENVDLRDERILGRDMVCSTCLECSGSEFK